MFNIWHNLYNYCKPNKKYVGISSDIWAAAVSNFSCLIHLPPHWDKIRNINNVKEERFILGPWFQIPVHGQLAPRQKCLGRGLVWKSWSPHCVQRQRDQEVLDRDTAPQLPSCRVPPHSTCNCERVNRLIPMVQNPWPSHLWKGPALNTWHFWGTF